MKEFLFGVGCCAIIAAVLHYYGIKWPVGILPPALFLFGKVRDEK